jgi:hypothetical protein
MTFSFTYCINDTEYVMIKIAAMVVIGAVLVAYLT